MCRVGEVAWTFIVGRSVICSLIRSRLYVNYYGLQFKFTHQVVLVIVALLVVTMPACGSYGTSTPPHWFELVRQALSVLPGYRWAVAPEVIHGGSGRSIV